MRRFRSAQTCGSLVVFGAFAAAELAANHLEGAPGSPLAWYLVLEVFAPFAAARTEGCPLHVLSGPNALALYGTLLLLVLAAHRARARFATALLSNLALIAAMMLAHAWFVLDRGAAVASLASVDLRREPDLLLLGLCAMSAIACLLGHVGFAGAAFERGARRADGRDGA